MNTVRYLLSMDNRMKEITLGYGDTGAYRPVHYRESDQTCSFVNHIMSIDDRPTIWVHNLASNQTAAEDKLPVAIGSTTTPYTPDLAHQPSMDYVAYMVTGDYYYLEEMYFWAGWDLTMIDGGPRQYSVGILSGETRRQAWAIRNIADAANLAPDADTLEKGYFTEKVNNNLVYWVDKFITNGDYPTAHYFEEGNPYDGDGIGPGCVKITSPWEDDFLLMVLAHLRDIGFDSQAMIDWQADTLIQRFHNPAMNPYRGPCYHLPTRYEDALGEIHQYETWEAVNAAFIDQPGPDHFNTLTGDDYQIIARAAMSYVLDLPYGQDIWNWYDSNLPGKEILNSYPGWAIVPPGYVPPADIAPPSAPYNLQVTDPTYTSLTVRWTAPGDDGLNGTATTYEMRYSTNPITAVNWGSATLVSSLPVPATSGTPQSKTVIGLLDDTTYYFAMKASDEVPNTSDMSVLASGTTLYQPDSVPPAAVTDLVVLSSTPNSVTLTWTAPGDDGTTGAATLYDVRYSMNTITDANWDSATPATGEPTPSMAGSTEYMTISGLSDDTTYYFAIKAGDEIPNMATLSNLAMGTTQIDPSTTITVTIEDFSNCGLASYTDYHGNIAPTGSAYLSGWDIGGRYFQFKDVSTDRIMSATYAYGGYDLGIALELSGAEYLPYWDASQQSEAINLADAGSLRFGVTLDLPANGMTGTSFTVTMYYYDTSAATTASVQILSAGSGAWTSGQTKSFPVMIDAISGFDKTQDLVYGFRIGNVWTQIGSVTGSYGLTSIIYTIPNGVPVVGAGDDQTINWPVDSVTLNGTATDDGRPNPPGTLTTTWSKAAGPGTVTFGDASALCTTATFSEAGIYTLQLQADDGAAQITDTCTITVNAANEAPAANAGDDQEITLPDGVTLNGSVSDDGLPNPPAAVTATWSMVSGPGTVTFADANAASTTATFSVAGTYTLQLLADDSALTATDSVTITVNPANQAPTVNAGDNQTITLPATAALDGTVTDDGLPNPPGALATTWSKISGPGTVTFADANAVDTTATFSTSGTYVLQLEASDSVLTATDDCTITVNPAGPPAGNNIDLTYLGAFEVASVSNVYGGDVTFYPSGNSGAGSLFVSRGSAGSGSEIYEVAIPTLVNTTDISLLNSVSPLQSFDASSSPKGLTYRSTDDRLYYSTGGTNPIWRSINRDGTSESTLQTTSWSYVGEGLCQIPDAWASSYADGKNLIGIGGHYGICVRAGDPWNNPMASLTALVSYTSSDTMTDYDSNDGFAGVEWVSVSGVDNIIVSGTDDSAAAATLYFYDPADIAGATNLYDPQPYKTVSVQDCLFSTDIGSESLDGLAYDATNHILYGYEGGYAKPTVVHAWALSTADTTAPSDVADLAAGDATSSTVTLTWTAPGDDGNTGTAAAYDIRYSASTITEANWDAATQVSGEPTPAEGGSSNESMQVTGLTPSTTYYFAIKTADEVPNSSGLSNIASVTTAEPPPPVARLSYLGAFKLASVSSFYGGDLTFYPSGDSGAGSLFISRGSTGGGAEVYEVPIPTLVNTTDITQLEQCDDATGI